jgi:hypothetical protein
VFVQLEDGIAYVAEEGSPLNDPVGRAAWPGCRRAEQSVTTLRWVPGECIFIEMGRTGEVDAA